jgi:hypothetical protein
VLKIHSNRLVWADFNAAFCRGVRERIALSAIQSELDLISPLASSRLRAPNYAGSNYAG